MYICAPPVCRKAREDVTDSCELEVLCSCWEQSLGACKHSATSLLPIYIYLHLQVTTTVCPPKQAP